MTVHEPPTAEIPSIEEVVRQHVNSAADRMVLVEALVEREEQIADVLRMSGSDFGLFPEIVAEVLAAIGLGRPMPVEQRVMIHNNYHALMERLRREAEGQ